jgi:hypothetical protein
MFGTCCEEQDAREKAGYTAFRAAVRQSESRLLKGQMLQLEAAQALRCGTGCMCCGPCKEEAAAEDQTDQAVAEQAGKEPNGTELSDEEYDDDVAEEALLRKMRAARMNELRDVVSAKRAEGVGAYQRVNEAWLLDSLGSAMPVILHLSLSDSAPSGWLDEHLATAAARYPDVRFLHFRCNSGPPACLAFALKLPALLLLEGGLVVSSADAALHAREPRQLAARVAAWMSEQLDMLKAARPVDDSQSEGEEEAAGYCGRKGCRAYPHEHVAWGNRPSA